MEHVPSRKEQSVIAEGAHTPSWQTPLSVHGSSSTHDAPSLPGTSTHVSLATSHVAMWHESLAGQNFVDPLQTPPSHESAVVHSFPSSHDAKSFAGSFWHSPLTHAPALHASLSAAQSSA
jgi:hypothetical protein